MNRTSGNCYRPELEFSFLVPKQVVALAIINSIMMTGNVIANMLVMHILIKTEQMASNTCKLIFMLSVSDLMIGLFGQNLLTTILYEKNCLLMGMCTFITVFFVHLSMYTIAIIGIDRYLRIKHYANFKALWTSRTVSASISVGAFLALLQAIMTLTGLLLEKEYIVIPVYSAIDGLIISGIIFLQLLTMRTSNAVYNESRITTSENTSKKIAELSMRIMLLFCGFITPHLLIYVLREIIQDKLNEHEKTWVDFFSVISWIVLYTNSFANAVLFLMTNMKAKRFFRNFVR